MNKLDYIDMKLDGEGTLPDIFKELGKVDFSEEMQSELSNDQSDVDMKATSVRLPVTLLNVLVIPDCIPALAVERVVLAASIPCLAPLIRVVS